MSMLKKIGVLTFLLIIAAIVSSCSPERVALSVPQASENDYDYEVIDPEPVIEEVELTLYYANPEYIATGDESLDKVIPVKRAVNLGGRSIEEAIVSELKIEPEGLTTLLDSIDILDVDAVEGIAYVNFSGEGLSGSSLAETLVLLQTIYSLTETENVNAVQFLISGSKNETLMGHIDIQEPLKREDIIMNVEELE